MDSIIKLEEMGYSFTIDNEDIRIGFISGTIPEPMEVERLLEDIKTNKQIAINFIEYRENEKAHKKAIEEGYLPYSFGECYGKQLTTNSFVFIQKLDDSKSWLGYRVTYDEDNNIVSEKTIIEDLDFKNAITRVEIYINNYFKFIDKIRA